MRRATNPLKFAQTSLIISIHALLAESDRLWTILYSCPGNFYPRSPCGERPIQHTQIDEHNDFYPRSPCGERPTTSDPEASNRTISIHALLAESDETFIILTKQLSNFYPRSPCGERPIGPQCVTSYNGFLSTLSLRRATTTTITIYIVLKFLSTLSLRRATPPVDTSSVKLSISIHALLAESDTWKCG